MKNEIKNEVMHIQQLFLIHQKELRKTYPKQKTNKLTNEKNRTYKIL